MIQEGIAIAGLMAIPGTICALLLAWLSGWLDGPRGGRRPPILMPDPWVKPRHRTAWPATQWVRAPQAISVAEFDAIAHAWDWADPRMSAADRLDWARAEARSRVLSRMKAPA